MSAAVVFTPRVEVDGAWSRVRIAGPVESTPGAVIVLDGAYPLVENGDPVTAATPHVVLRGAFRVRRAACGLGCRCDATVTPEAAVVRRAS
jgi:hypothetical protein